MTREWSLLLIVGSALVAGALAEVGLMFMSVAFVAVFFVLAIQSMFLYLK